jgi:hypothetical protein
MSSYWVPKTCAGLRDQLRRMGVTHISGRPIARVRRAQLYAVFFKMRNKTLSPSNSIKHDDAPKLYSSPHQGQSSGCPENGDASMSDIKDYET